MPRSAIEIGSTNKITHARLRKSPRKARALLLWRSWRFKMQLPMPKLSGLPLLATTSAPRRRRDQEEPSFPPNPGFPPCEICSEG